MRIADFELERFFARWEFAAKYNLAASDAEPVTMRELLALADPDLSQWWESLSLGYTETPGHPLLRAEIAKQYTTVDGEQVLTFAGGQEAIFLLQHALLRPGDAVAVVVPAYQSLHEVARSIGAQVIELPLQQDGQWRLDLSRMPPHVRALVINYPHNPTGALLEPAAFQELCRFCDERGIHLISDEVYRGLEYAPGDRLPSAADLTPFAVSIGVMSKSYGLAGLRLGWIATRDSALLQKVARLKDYTTICSSAPSEVLSCMALRNAAVLQTRALDIIERNLGLWHGLIERNADVFDWVPPRAGSVGFPRLRSGDADEFCAGLVAQHGVLLLPGAKFGAAYRAHFRAGLGRRGIEEPLGLIERFARR